MHTDRQTETYLQTNRLTYRQTYIQTDIHTYSLKVSLSDPDEPFLASILSQ